MDEDLGILDITLAQLAAVQEVAEYQFYLTTQELAMLLGIDADFADPVSGTAITPRFKWRNFVCQWMEQQGNWHYWSVTNAAKATIQIPAIARQTTSTQAEVSVDITAAKHVQLDQFLSPELVDELLDYVVAAEPRFVPTSVSGIGDLSYRKSMLLPAFSPYSEMMIERIRAIVPDLLSKFGIPSFAIGQIESQLTMHNDQNFYKEHNDNGSEDTATRELSYVYYFYHQPKSFSGGELRMYDVSVENNFYVAAETFFDIEPRHNSIVFFPSHQMHEVLTVNCPSRQFRDSRFTINGWVRRA